MKRQKYRIKFAPDGFGLWECFVFGKDGSLLETGKGIMASERKAVCDQKRQFIQSLPDFKSLDEIQEEYG